MREVGGLRGLHAIVVACGGHPCADRQREARTGADQHTEVVGGGAASSEPRVHKSAARAWARWLGRSAR